MMISKRVCRKNEPDFRLEIRSLICSTCSSNVLIVIKQLFSRAVQYVYNICINIFLHEFLIWIRLNL